MAWIELVVDGKRLLTHCARSYTSLHCWLYLAAAQWQGDTSVSVVGFVVLKVEGISRVFGKMVGTVTAQESRDGTFHRDAPSSGLVSTCLIERRPRAVPTVPGCKYTMPFDSTLE
jgi:hypothetical protein